MNPFEANCAILGLLAFCIIVPILGMMPRAVEVSASRASIVFGDAGAQWA